MTLNVDRQIQPWPPSWMETAHLFSILWCTKFTRAHSSLASTVHWLVTLDLKITSRQSMSPGHYAPWVVVHTGWALSPVVIYAITACSAFFHLFSKGIWQMSFLKQILAPMVEDHWFREQQRKSRNIWRGWGKEEEKEAPSLDFLLSQVSQIVKDMVFQRKISIRFKPNVLK